MGPTGTTAAPEGFGPTGPAGATGATGAAGPAGLGASAGFSGAAGFRWASRPHRRRLLLPARIYNQPVRGRPLLRDLGNAVQYGPHQHGGRPMWRRERSTRQHPDHGGQQPRSGWLARREGGREQLLRDVDHDVRRPVANHHNYDFGCWYTPRSRLRRASTAPRRSSASDRSQIVLTVHRD